MIQLDSNQESAVSKLRPGSVLVGGTGSGKSLTALTYYARNYLERPLFIITTAQKRDLGEWKAECVNAGLDPNTVTVDSWNMITDYKFVIDSFFIFDEQRTLTYGVWTKTFIEIAKHNPWLMLSATPGDDWLDYIGVFIANGFYKTKTDFCSKHVIWDGYARYPKIARFTDTDYLVALRELIIVDLDYLKKTVQHHEYVLLDYPREQYAELVSTRWNPWKNEPCDGASGLCHCLRRVTIETPNRLAALAKIIKQYPRLIIFYNYNYELQMLTEFCTSNGIEYTEWNGHRHCKISKSKSWCHLVQYNAGREAWNCTETNAMVFFSENYSYAFMIQAAGRIDRRDTKFKDLWYYHFVTNAPIDIAIRDCIDKKRVFNEERWLAHGNLASD